MESINSLFGKRNIFVSSPSNFTQKQTTLKSLGIKDLFAPKNDDIDKEIAFYLDILYKDTDEKSIETCEIFIELKPDFVRIYPTIVLKHTLLEKLYNDGVYHPQTVEDAANICVKLLNKFESAGIPVIRLGLHTIDTDEYVAGPWHAAFGEICESLIVLNKLKQLITKSGSYNVYVHPSMHSKTIGHGKSNLNALSKENIIIKVISDKNCDKGQIKIEEVR